VLTTRVLIPKRIVTALINGKDLVMAAGHSLWSIASSSLRAVLCTHLHQRAGGAVSALAPDRYGAARVFAGACCKVEGHRSTRMQSHRSTAAQEHSPPSLRCPSLTAVPLSHC
jgi:hypothetical protein